MYLQCLQNIDFFVVDYLNITLLQTRRAELIKHLDFQTCVMPLNWDFGPYEFGQRFLL